MLVTLTDSNNKSDITVAAHVVVVAQRNPQNPLATRVITGMMGPQGPFAFEVLESPETIRNMVNQALHTQAMMDNGQSVPLATLSGDKPQGPTLVKS